MNFGFCSRCLLSYILISAWVDCPCSLVFNRKAGFIGGGWHTHAYSEDGLGRTIKIPRLGEVRNLIYPQGFRMVDDGGLGVVRGGHLYRDHTLRARDDEEMDTKWLAGKSHPITGKPLVREHLELPPGSLVAALTHVPHVVGPRKEGVRHAALMVYANPDHSCTLPQERIRGDPQSTQLSEKERLELNFLRRSAFTPTTHADGVPIEWRRLAAAGRVPGVDGVHANLFFDR